MTDKFTQHAGLIEQARAYCTDSGLTSTLVPDELMKALKRAKLVICAGSLMPPNIKGLESRWFLVFSAEDESRIRRDLDHLRKLRDAAVTG